MADIYLPDDVSHADIERHFGGEITLPDLELSDWSEPQLVTPDGDGELSNRLGEFLEEELWPNLVAESSIDCNWIKFEEFFVRADPTKDVICQVRLAAKCKPLERECELLVTPNYCGMEAGDDGDRFVLSYQVELVREK